MSTTENFGLRKPGADEFYNIEDFNGNMDVIDEELKKLSEKDVPIDDVLSDTSVNPVQNKVVTSAIGSKANKPTEEAMTLLASNWVGESAPYTYDLGIGEEYDIEVLLPNTATVDEVEAITSAQISGNGSDNILRSWGEKMAIDVGIVLRKAVR